MKKLIERVRKVNLQKAGICSLIIAGIGLLTHILVLTKILPYTWVNGGRTESFEDAISIAVSSIVIITINSVITLIASGIVKVKMNRLFGIALTVFLVIGLPFSFLGIVQQFLGTLFEKCIMSIVTIVAFCADFRIAVEKRW